MVNAMPSCALFQRPFYFLRHGETETNHPGLIAGQTDVELNETGWVQARAAAALLSGKDIDAIYASPLKRASDTAGCVSAVLGIEIAVVPGLAERNWGELEGKPREQRVGDVTPPGGESPEAFARRTLAGFASIPASRLPLVVAHSGTFRVLCDDLGLPRRQQPVENCRPLQFVPPLLNGGTWTIETL